LAAFGSLGFHALQQTFSLVVTTLDKTVQAAKHFFINMAPDALVLSLVCTYFLMVGMST
jgi:hypothetical protein